MSGKYVITKQSNGQYHFTLKAGNGETILSSESYINHSGCLNGIESVKTNSPQDERYERKTSSNGKPYFNLKAANHQIIGTSEQYSTEAAREKGIASVKSNGPTTVIKEQP